MTATTDGQQEGLQAAMYPWASYLPESVINAWMVALEAGETNADEAWVRTRTASDVTADIVLLGQYLVQNKLISILDLQDALDLQRVCAMDGERLLLGQALVRMGTIDQETLDAAVSLLIIQLKRESFETSGERRTLYQRAISMLTAPRWRNSSATNRRVRKAQKKQH